MIILASKSPRRSELLKREGINFVIESANTKEVFNDNLSLEDALLDVAKQKVMPIAKKHLHDIIIGADTIVYCDNQVLGKPKDESDAIRMLSLLSGKTHQVQTAVVIIKDGNTIQWVEKTNVTFKEITLQEIKRYISSYNVYDKAGSYAIQDGADIFISNIDGDYDNIVGLPVKKVIEIINN